MEEHRGTVEPLPETGRREDRRGVPFHVGNKYNVNIYIGNRHLMSDNTTVRVEHLRARR